MTGETVVVKSASKPIGRFQNDFEAIITDMSRSQDSKDRGKTWSYHETLELIKNWGDDEMQEQLSTTLRNYHVYGVIAKKMTLKGYRRTAEQCRCKIKGMKLMYRKCKDEGDVEKAQKTFTYYRLMDSIMSRRPLSPSTRYNRCETGFDTPGTSRGSGGPVIENVMTDHVLWSGGACPKVEKIDESEVACEFYEGQDNSNDVELIDECETVAEDGDSDPGTTLLPLDVQIENSEENNDIEMPKIGKIEMKRELESPDLSPVDSPSPKRKRLSKAIRQQEHLADRILSKFVRKEERLIHLFLEAEEKMMSKVEQMEERRMKFEQELAEKQHREDALRFERLVQLLSQTSTQQQQQQQQQAPPRVVYMQEVNPPNWTA